MIVCLNVLFKNKMNSEVFLAFKMVSGRRKITTTRILQGGLV